jgi:predicted ATPase/DNA-binding SARP family transcriptional activator
MGTRLAVRLLGPVVLAGPSDRGGDEVALRGHAARLVALLALEDRARGVDELADLLWPAGPPATARTVIHGLISRLRRQLPTDGAVHIATVPDGYRLQTPGGDPACSPVDVRRFRALVERAPAPDGEADARRAAADLGAALALWNGPALGGVRDDPMLRPQADALDGERRGAETALAEALVHAGDLDRALAVLGRLLTDEPLEERRWALLMIALTRAGRQADALRAYRRAATELAERTGLEPGPELRRLETAVLLQDPSLQAPRWRPGPGALPLTLTTVVGRDDDRRRVIDRLGSARVVTLVGPGGVGKTTLAHDVASAVAADMGDGAVVVDLGPLAASDVAPAIATTVAGPSPAGSDSDALERVADAVSRRELLVVLNGCEHVRQSAAAAVVALARAGRGVRVLATSLTALDVAGEVVVPLEPLGSDAGAELLAHRLDELGIPVSDTDARHVRAIARSLDGLPLAIEVAAAMARFEPLGVLAERLGQDASLVLDAMPPTGTSRRPLRAALDAACERLDDETTRIYACLGAFPATFDADAAAAAGGVATADAAAALARLTDASLVVVDSTDRQRSRLLEPVRAHARARLTGEERSVVERRIALWTAALADELDRVARSRDQACAVARLDAELPTVRFVLRMHLDAGEVDDAGRLFAHLVLCWVDSAHHAEAMRWADELLARADELDPASRARVEVAAVHAQYAFELIAARLDVAEGAVRRAREAGDAFSEAAAMAQVGIGLGWLNTDLDRAAELLGTARSSLLTQGEAYWAALALELSGLLALRRLDIAAGIATLEAAVAEYHRHGGPADIAHALTFIGYAQRAVGELLRARRAFDEAARVLGPIRVGTWLRAVVGSAHASLAFGDHGLAEDTFRTAHERAVEVGDQRIVGTALAGMAEAARARGDVERSIALFDAAADAALAGGDPTDAVTAAGVLGELLAERGEPDEAAVLLGASELVDGQVGVRVDFGLVHDVEPLRAELVERLGEARVTSLGSDGRVIGLRPALRRAVERLLDR